MLDVVWDRLAGGTVLGRWFIGGALLGEGLRQAVTMEFVRLVPEVPAWLPATGFWSVLTGGLLILSGAGILLDRKRSLAASVVAAALVVVLLVLYVPVVAADPLTGFKWTNPMKTLSLIGGALVLAGLPAGARSEPIVMEGSRLTRLRPVARYLLGLFLFVCGVQHFFYAPFVDSLVPAWIPLAPRFWTWLTGVALIAGGVGVVLPRTTRLAALLSALMVFLWLVLLHLPRAVTTRSAGELDGVFEAMAIGGVALLVAGVARPVSRAFIRSLTS